MKPIKILFLLLLIISGNLYSQNNGFIPEFNLIDINGINGFEIYGTNQFDSIGHSNASAGDLNGDGLDDMIIANTFVIFGDAAGFPNPLETSSLNGSNGFKIISTGGSTDVNTISDINGDGLDDIIIGSAFSSPNGITQAGVTYIVFGNNTGFTASLDLSNLNNENGFIIQGNHLFGSSGISVSSAGDLNADGINDILIGAPGASRSGFLSEGSSYVIFGSDSGYPNPLDLATLNGQNGFTIHGNLNFSRSGRSVSSAGDVNGDGIDDVIIGAHATPSNGFSEVGKSYIIFGSKNDFPNPLLLTNLNGDNGFIINGDEERGMFGWSVDGAGDINADGVDDLIIGAYLATAESVDESGLSYVLFGNKIGFPNEFNVSDLDGDNGFVIHGITRFQGVGYSVSSAGDVNVDGIDDIIIGTNERFINNELIGSSFIIFGSKDNFANPFELSNLDGQNGIIINGISDSQRTGRDVNSVGDINGDGVGDVIIGSEFASPNGNFPAGISYVIFGSNTIGTGLIQSIPVQVRSPWMLFLLFISILTIFKFYSLSKNN